MLPLNSFPFFEKKNKLYIKKGHYSNCCPFEMAGLVNVPGIKEKR